jgi:hypothetical protein
MPVIRVSYHVHMLRVILVAWILAARAFAAQIVEGQVVNSATGVGISGVAVSLVQSGKIAYSATTDLQGRFRIEAVRDGTYTANYSVRSFWPVPSWFDHGNQPSFQVASAGEPVHLNAKLQQIGKLSGRVLDAAGTPVPNASLWLVWGASWCSLPCASPSLQVKTNEKGEYTVTNLDSPGTWQLSATAPASWNLPESGDGQQLGWAQTFYPGVTDPQLAEEVMVRP